MVGCHNIPYQIRIIVNRGDYVKGEDIVSLIEKWLEDNKVHPDDFDSMFAEELLEIMSKDK